jgi:hypothetical protein
MVRSLLVGLLLALGCARGDHPGQPAGSAGAAHVDAGAPPPAGIDVDAGPSDPGRPPDAGVADAGAAVIGVPDAGIPDAGGPDAGTAAIDCAPYGAAQLAWEIVGYQNPANNYLASLYAATGGDGLDGVVINHIILSGQEETQIRGTYGPDGVVRIGAIAGLFCHPVLGCSQSFAVARNGRVFSSEGAVWASADGHLIYRIDPAPPGALGFSGKHLELVGSDGTNAAFVFNDWHVLPTTSLVTAVDGSGTTLWQRAFPQQVASVAVDEGTRITLLRWFPAPEVTAIDSSGNTLYTVPATGSVPDLQAAGGRFYVGGQSILSASDGTPALTLPFAPGFPVLTSSRLVAVHADQAGRTLVSSFDLASAKVSWEREALSPGNSTLPPFTLSDERTLVLDPDRVLHVVEADGSDAIACKLAPDANSPVLLSGGRLAVSVSGNVRLQVYDLPWPR